MNHQPEASSIGSVIHLLSILTIVMNRMCSCTDRKKTMYIWGVKC